MANSDDFNPYDDLDDAEEQLGASERSSPAGMTPGYVSASNAIDADKDPEDGFFASVKSEAEDFEDYTPRQTKFEAPSAEDVLVDGASFQPGRKTQRQAAKQEQRVSRRQARLEAKREKQEQRAVSKMQRAAEKEATKQNREQMLSGPPPAEGNNDDRRLVSASATAAGVAVLALVGGFGFYSLWSTNTDMEASEVVASVESSTMGPNSSEASAATSNSALEPSESLVELVESLCSDKGASSRGGDSTTPEGAIRGFTHAYYVEKSATTVMQFLDDALYDSEETLQEGIDTPSNGDAFCLSIKETGKKDVFVVTRLEYKAGVDGTPELERESTQRVTTSKRGDEWQIVGIDSA